MAGQAAGDLPGAVTAATRARLPDVGGRGGADSWIASPGGRGRTVVGWGGLAAVGDYPPVVRGNEQPRPRAKRLRRHGHAAAGAAEHRAGLIAPANRAGARDEPVDLATVRPRI